MNKGQLVTRYIKHLAESANFKGGPFNKRCNGLIGNRFEMPNVSYTHPLCNTMKRKVHQHKYYKNGNLAHFNSNWNNRIYS